MQFGCKTSIRHLLLAGRWRGVRRDEIYRPRSPGEPVSQYGVLAGLRVQTFQRARGTIGPTDFCTSVSPGLFHECAGPAPSGEQLFKWPQGAHFKLPFPLSTSECYTRRGSVTSSTEGYHATDIFLGRSRRHHPDNDDHASPSAAQSGVRTWRRLVPGQPAGRLRHLHRRVRHERRRGLGGVARRAYGLRRGCDDDPGTEGQPVPAGGGPLYSNRGLDTFLWHVELMITRTWREGLDVRFGIRTTPLHIPLTAQPLVMATGNF